MSEHQTMPTPVRGGCPICNGTERRIAGGLTWWHDNGHPERDAPMKFAVDAAGYVWRVFEGGGLDGDDLWSMAPVNPDNAPIPGPVTYYGPVSPGGAPRFCPGCTAALLRIHDAAMAAPVSGSQQ